MPSDEVEYSSTVGGDMHLNKLVATRINSEKKKSDWTTGDEG